MTRRYLQAVCTDDSTLLMQATWICCWAQGVLRLQRVLLSQVYPAGRAVISNSTLSLAEASPAPSLP